MVLPKLDGPVSVPTESPSLRLIPAGQPIRAGVAVLALLLAPGCSSNPADAPPPTIEPAQAAVSPPVTGAPDGELRPVGGRAQAALFDSATATLAVLGPGPDGQAMVTLMTGPQAPRTVLLPATASAMTGDGHGGLLLATRGGYFRVDIAAGKANTVSIGGEQDTAFTAIAVRADGKAVLGSADGAVYTVSAPDRVGAKLKVVARVDALVTEGNTAVVLGRGQSSVTAVAGTGTKAEQALRA